MAKPTKETATPVDVKTVGAEELPPELQQGQYVPAVRQKFELSTAGSVDLEGISPPYLKITHGVGKLQQAGFTPGDFVLSDTHALVGKEEPLKVTILNYSQYWKQYLTRDQFDEGLVPLSFESEADANTAGFSTRWSGDTGPQVSRAMDWLLLIQKPDELVCPLFGIEIEGKEHTLAILSLDKMAYRAVDQIFLNALHIGGLAKKGVWVAEWALSTMYKASRRNSTHGSFVPKLVQLGLHPADFNVKIMEALGGHVPEA